jgi:hypothetical protein
LIERRREQLQQAAAAIHQLSVDRGHGASGTTAFAGARYDRPGLGDGIDTALIAGDGPQWRTVVVIAAAIPVAVPGFPLDGLLQRKSM